MSVNSPHELFVFMLNSARQSTRPTTRIFQELGEAAENAVFKEALEAGVFVAEGVVEKDQCFKLMADRPVILRDGRRRSLSRISEELAEIYPPIARQLYILAKANQLAHCVSAST